jgi:hypothetical protein
MCCVSQLDDVNVSAVASKLLNLCPPMFLSLTNERLSAVEHVLPDDWKLDSDPQPVKLVDNKALFRVNAEPGEIVRMHVGEHHADPISGEQTR